jgi:predicted N-acetyltransferase YhbS
MLEFRREDNSDRDQIYRIHQNAFQRDDEAQLVEKLRKNNQFNPNLSFVALVDKKIIGHILFTPIQISSKSISSLALAPISILSEYQRQGIGSQLIEYALNQLKSQGFPSVIVLGHEHFYPKFGFLPAKKYNIQAPIPLENENCFMALELKPQAFPIDDKEGIVQYLPDFGL